MSRTTHRRRLALATGAALAGLLFLSACSTDTNDTNNDKSSGSNQPEATSNNDDPGKKVVIGFSGPAADHGWLAAINSSALSEAKKYSDVSSRPPRAPTTPASRSARSRPSSTTRSTRSCCCRPTAPR